MNFVFVSVMIPEDFVTHRQAQAQKRGIGSWVGGDKDP